MDAPTLPLPRSYLFVPADRPDRVPKALATEADAVIVDLEDAVAEGSKSAARDALAALAPLARSAGPRLWVRVNARPTPHFRADLQMLADWPAAGVLLPKTETAEDVIAVRAAMPQVQVIGLIETARGLAAAPSLGAVRGLARLAFGSIDYALDIGGIDPDDLDALLHARSTLVWASRVAGLPQPIDGVTAAIDDEAALLRDAAHARRLGFGAKMCIHPKQVARVNETFAPTAAEIAWAHSVIDALDAAGGAAVQAGGAMIDRPVRLRAERILALGGSGRA